jgi:hypothetical protein
MKTEPGIQMMQMFESTYLRYLRPGNYWFARPSNSGSHGAVCGPFSVQTA